MVSPVRQRCASRQCARAAAVLRGALLVHAPERARKHHPARGDRQHAHRDGPELEPERLKAVEQPAVRASAPRYTTTSITFFALYFSSRPTTVKNTWRAGFAIAKLIQRCTTWNATTTASAGARREHREADDDRSRATPPPRRRRRSARSARPSRTPASPASAGRRRDRHRRRGASARRAPCTAAATICACSK